MSWWSNLKKKGFSIPILKIEFSTGGKKLKVHSIKIGGVKEIKRSREHE